MLALKPTHVAGGIVVAAIGAVIVPLAGAATAETSTANGLSPRDLRERCMALSAGQFGKVTIDKVEVLEIGASTSFFGTKLTTATCRVTAHVSAGAGSNIKFRAWLPANWNGKMLGYGGGGFNGAFAIDSLILTKEVNRGYASLTTDAGHDSGEPSDWAIGKPERVLDFAYRANHLGALATKEMVKTFYGVSVKRAYFHGCSNGGRDALILAQRFPADYDAIISGAPANSWSALLSSFAQLHQTTKVFSSKPALLPKLKLIHDAAVKACDADDGLRDGLISNPASCRFDPAVLQCSAGDSTSCLSKPQVTAVHVIYDGTRTRDGRLLMSGYPRGSELDWAEWFAAPKSSLQEMAEQYYRHIVYKDPSWDLGSFVLDRDYPVAKRRTAQSFDATNPDLRPFLNRGGKLLMYHGWEDPAIPAGSSIQYYRAMQVASGKAAANTRLFLMPGLGHCGLGTASSTIDPLDELDRWVEGGNAPSQIIATKYKDERRAFVGLGGEALATRPVCAWPKSPHYRGAGSTTAATSFVCR